MLIPLSASSQTIYKQRVYKSVNENNDTIISFLLSDAKFLLSELKVAELNDSIIRIYQHKVTLQDSIIFNQNKQITLLEDKNTNSDKINYNQGLLLDNKDMEISIYEDIIKQQNRSIRKAKITKIILIGIITVSPLMLLIGR
jgi:hypothetical protein